MMTIENAIEMAKKNANKMLLPYFEGRKPADLKHLFTGKVIDGCEILNEKGTHNFRLEETLKHGIGKEAATSFRTNKKGEMMRYIITTNAIMLVFTMEGELKTIEPQSPKKLTSKDWATFFAAGSIEAKQILKKARENMAWNIWDFENKEFKAAMKNA